VLHFPGHQDIAEGMHRSAAMRASPLKAFSVAGVKSWRSLERRYGAAI
jgi:hypothetical protein